MPTVKTYRGDSVPVAKVVNANPVGPIVAGQVFTAWCNGKSAAYTALSGDTISAVVTGLASAISTAAGTIAEFGEFLASPAADGLTLVLTAATAGVPFDVTFTCSGNLTVVETTAGHGGQNEVHKISLVGNYTGGTFTVTYNFGAGNVTTGNIAYNATASTMQTALTALTGVGTGNVLVTGGAGPANPWFVTWTGSLGSTSIAPGTVNGTNLTGGAMVIITETQAGNGLSDEIQLLDCSVCGHQGGFNFTLTLDSQTTSTINTNSTAAQIQTALEALPNIGSGNIAVYGQQINNLEPIFYAIHFKGALAATDVNQLVVGGWGQSFSAPVMSTLQNGGQTSSDDFQWIDLATTSQENFTLTYKGQTTGNLNTLWGQASYPIQAMIQALSTVGSGNAMVYLPAVTNMTAEIISAYLIRFTGSKANTAQSLFTVTAAGSPTVTRISIGGANKNEIQTIATAATGGTFTLTAGAQTTSAIAYNASAGTLQTRIQTDLSSTIVACTTSGTGTLADPWVVTVTNPAHTPIALLTANSSSLTGGAGTIVELTPGSAGANEVQTITLATGVSGGTYTLAFGGLTTEPLPWNSTSAQVQAALKSLSTINTVTVSGSAGGPWTVTWSGAQGNALQPLLVADGSLLTGMTTNLITLVTSVWSAGPEHYDDPSNWSPYGIPDAGFRVYFAQSKSDCLYGLEQIATFTVNTGTNLATWTSKSDLQNGQAVYCTSTNTLPSPLAGNTLYYLVNVNRDARTFQLATSVSGTPVTLTTTGTGTHTLGPRLGYLEVSSTFTGKLGLPYVSDAGYVEYRSRYLHIGLQTIANGGTQQIVIGTGDGSGSSKVQLNTDIDAVSGKIINSGGSTDPGVNAIVWLGTNAANAWNLVNGDFGSCLFPGEVANMASFTERAGSCTLGAGVTIAGPIDKTGGSIIIDGATINGVVYSR